jgi:NAD/NADP transhydrogenase beta subunit
LFYLGGFGTGTSTYVHEKTDLESDHATTVTVEKVAEMMKQAKSIIIVPGNKNKIDKMQYNINLIN